MMIEEWREQTRLSLEETLNQLHTASLLVETLEAQLAQAGKTVQHLTGLIEQFMVALPDDQLEQPTRSPE